MIHGGHAAFVLQFVHTDEFTIPEGDSRIRKPKRNHVGPQGTASPHIVSAADRQTNRSRSTIPTTTAISENAAVSHTRQELIRCRRTKFHRSGSDPVLNRRELRPDLPISGIPSSQSETNGQTPGTTLASPVCARYFSPSHDILVNIIPL